MLKRKIVQKRVIALVLAIILLAAIPILTASAVGEAVTCSNCNLGVLKISVNLYCPDTMARRYGVCAINFIYCTRCNFEQVYETRNHVNVGNHMCGGCACTTHF